ncbi:MAG: hypothetical protein QW220_00550 [Candidatus Bathyarchaeia archaeon]
MELGVYLQPQYCSPRCQFFRCNQRALGHKENMVWCSFANDVCQGYKCNYAQCLRGRLLVNGLCGMTIKRQTTEEPPIENEQPKVVKVRSKLIRKLGEREIF